MLASFNLESGKLPPSIMLPPGGSSGEMIMNSRSGGVDGTSSIDLSDRKRSVSFAPTSHEGEDGNRIAIGNISQNFCMCLTINRLEVI